MPVNCVSANENKTSPLKSIIAPLTAGAIACGMEKTLCTPKELKLAQKVIKAGEDSFISQYAKEFAEDSAECVKNIDKNTIAENAKTAFKVLQEETKSMTNAIRKHSIVSGLTVTGTVIALRALSNSILKRKENQQNNSKTPINA